MQGDAAALAPLQVLLHGAGLLHEDLQLVEAAVGAAHHGVELRDGDHLNHLCSGERCMMCSRYYTLGSQFVLSLRARIAVYVTRCSPREVQ